jgi:hypothetical protein
MIPSCICQVKNGALKWLREYYAVVPRDTAELQQCIIAFIEFLTSWEIVPALSSNLKATLPIEDTAGWMYGGHFQAPAIAASEAMRQELICIGQKHLTELLLAPRTLPA